MKPYAAAQFIHTHTITVADSQSVSFPVMLIGDERSGKFYTPEDWERARRLGDPLLFPTTWSSHEGFLLRNGHRSDAGPGGLRCWAHRR